MAIQKNDASIYRCTEYCQKCPFKDNGESMRLKEGRVDSIKEELLRSSDHSFNCHKTVYGSSSTIDSSKGRKEMFRHGVILEQKRENFQMRIAYITGLDTP